MRQIDATIEFTTIFSDTDSGRLRICIEKALVKALGDKYKKILINENSTLFPISQNACAPAEDKKQIGSTLTSAPLCEDAVNNSVVVSEIQVEAKEDDLQPGLPSDEEFLKQMSERLRKLSINKKSAETIVVEETELQPGLEPACDQSNKSDLVKRAMLI